MGWLWFVLAALLVTAGWLVPALYVEHLVRQGRYDQALRLVPILGTSILGRSRRRADVLTAAGQYKEAARVLRDVVHRVRGKRVTKTARLTTCFDLENLGNVLMEIGRFEEAQRFFLDASRLYPYHSTWAIGMAEVFLRKGINPESALAQVEIALSLFDRGAERITSRFQLGAILATRAWALAACGRGIEAQEAIDAALASPVRKAKGPLAQVHYKAGMSLLALCDNRGAEKHFARGAELDPGGRWGKLCANAVRHKKQNSIPPAQGE